MYFIYLYWYNISGIINNIQTKRPYKQTWFKLSKLISAKILHGDHIVKHILMGHLISQCVRIVATIPKQTETDMLSVTCPVLHGAWHMTPVTCHLSLRPTSTATNPPPANSPLWTVGWFARPEKKTTQAKHQNSKYWYTTQADMKCADPQTASWDQS